MEKQTHSQFQTFLAFDIYYEHSEERTVLVGWFGECLTEKSSNFGVAELLIIE